jgi:hypothetical protein
MSKLVIGEIENQNQLTLKMKCKAYAPIRSRNPEGD